MATILHLLSTCPVTPNSSHFTQLPSHSICSRIIKAVSNKSFLIHKDLMEEKGSSPHSTAKGTSLASGHPCLEPPSLYSWGVQAKTHLAEDVRWALLYQLLGQLLSCINQHRSFEFHIACEFTSSWEALPWAVIKYAFLKSLAWREASGAVSRQALLFTKRTTEGHWAL